MYFKSIVIALQRHCDAAMQKVFPAPRRSLMQMGDSLRKNPNKCKGAMPVAPIPSDTLQATAIHFTHLLAKKKSFNVHLFLLQKLFSPSTDVSLRDLGSCTENFEFTLLKFKL